MKGPLNDLVALLPLPDKEDAGEKTYTPDSAKILKRGQVLDIGSPIFAFQGVTVDKLLKKGDIVLYPKSAEERKDRPAVLQEIDGQEVLLISYTDLFCAL